MQQPNALSGLSPQKFSLKEFLILFPKKTCSEKFSYILGTAALFSSSSKNKKIPPRKMELSNSNIKKFLIFLETKTLKTAAFFSSSSKNKKIENGTLTLKNL